MLERCTAMQWFKNQGINEIYRFDFGLRNFTRAKTRQCQGNIQRVPHQKQNFILFLGELRLDDFRKSETIALD